MNRPLLVLLTVAVVGQSTAKAADDPKRWHHGGMTVILHNGHTQFNTVIGDNPLDPPKTVTCESVKGCLISLSSWADASDNGHAFLQLCGLVDGNPAPPSCPGQSDNNKTIRQSIKVPQGSHAIQTVIVDPSGNGTVYSWEADYTIYEKGN